MILGNVQGHRERVCVLPLLPLTLPPLPPFLTPFSSVILALSSHFSILPGRCLTTATFMHAAVPTFDPAVPPKRMILTTSPRLAYMHAVYIFIVTIMEKKRLCVRRINNSTYAEKRLDEDACFFLLSLFKFKACLKLDFFIRPYNVIIKRVTVIYGIFSYNCISYVFYH